MKRKENNKGFTLVELIIAIAILAIAASPLIANFIQSSKMNLQGRKNLNAMNLAQDVMEGMSAYQATEVQEMMASVSANALVGKVLPTGSTYDNPITVNTSVPNVYTYTVKNVETASTSRNKYDLVMTLDATDANYADYNDKELATITKIDQYYDSIFKIPDNDISEAVSWLVTHSTEPSKTIDDYLGNMARTIEVRIENTATAVSDPPVYSVSVDRTYDVVTSKEAALGLTAADVYTIPSGNISKASVDVMPRSVYLYFEGMEGAVNTNSNILDNIKVVNTTGNDVTVYLIRTQPKGTEATNATYNENYRCRVDVTAQDMTGSYIECVKLVSNLRYNLSYPPEENFRKYEEGTTTALPDVDIAATNYYSADRAQYYYNDSANKIEEVMYKDNISDGYAKEKKNIIYKVQLDIYEPGTTKKVATYTGGITD